MINVNGIDWEFNFHPNGKSKDSLPIIQKCLSEGKPFKIETKNTYAIFIPSELTAYYSVNRSFMKYQSMDAMLVNFGMLTMICTKIIPASLVLENEIKLLKN